MKATKAEEIEGPTMKFAIVDDREPEANLVKELIEAYADKNGLSIQLDCFPNGEAFLADFSAFAYDIVFMDIYMDGMNGVETALEFRKTDTKSMLIFLTSSSEYMP